MPAPGGDQPPADDLCPAPPAHGGSRPGVHGPDGETAASRNCSQMTKYQILATLIRLFVKHTLFLSFMTFFFSKTRHVAH